MSEDCRDCLRGAFEPCTGDDCLDQSFLCCDDECPSASFVGWDWACCSGQDSGTTAPGTADDCPDCQPTTPAEKGPAVAVSGSDSIIDDQEMEEILARCCCGIDFAPLAQLPLAVPSPPAFVCKWDSCILTFETKALLVAHVNAAHLFPDDHCLFDCGQPPPVSDPVQPNDAELLLRHLLESHVTPLQNAEPPSAPVTLCVSEPHQHHVHETVARSTALSLPIHEHHDHDGSDHQSHSHSHPHSHMHPSNQTGHDHVHVHGHAHSHAHAHAHTHPHPPPNRKSKSPPTHPYGVTHHLPTPSPSLSGSHTCDWEGCTLSFDSSAELMTHLGAEHVGKGKPSYACLWDACGKRFSQRQKIMRHLQTHTGDRPFTCDVCQKSFSEATTLTQHMRVHTHERPYECTHPGCGKAFALASALTIHLRTHSGAKPFKCTHPGCDAAFAESSNLSKHMRTHEGVRSHACPECGKAFMRSDQLARHRRVHARARSELIS